MCMLKEEFGSVEGGSIAENGLGWKGHAPHSQRLADMRLAWSPPICFLAWPPPSSHLDKPPSEARTFHCCWAHDCLPNFSEGTEEWYFIPCEKMGRGLCTWEKKTGHTKGQIWTQDVPTCWKLLGSKCRTHPPNPPCTRCCRYSSSTTPHVHFLKVSRCFLGFFFSPKLFQVLMINLYNGSKTKGRFIAVETRLLSEHRTSVPMANWQLPWFAHSRNYFRSLGPSWGDILLSLRKVV